MPKYLISCCNTERLLSEFALVVFDSDSRERPFSYLDLEHSGLNFEKIRGFTGICAVPGGYAVGIQAIAIPSAILYLDYDLNPIRHFRLSRQFDVHSMTMYDSKLLFAATATNQIVAIDLDSGKESVFWDADNARNLHVNDFVFCQGELIVMAHQNPHHTQDRFRKGVVFEARSKKLLMEDLWHPHDLFPRADGTVVAVSSEAGRIYSLDTATRRVGLERELSGYARGFYQDRDGVVVGISGVRMHSRKEGAGKRYFRGSFDEYYRDPVFQSFVATYGSLDGPIEYRPFSYMNFEIYNVQRLAEASRPKLLSPNVVRRHMVVQWLFRGG